MKKLATVGMTVCALLATASVAMAQVAPIDVGMTGVVTPSKGGTKKKPKNGTLGFEFTVNKESWKTVSTIEVMVPQNVKLDGTGFKYCSAATINAAGPSVDGCPKGSKLGEGTASAVLGPAQSPLNFTTEVYAAGKNEIALYLRGNGNAVNVAFQGPISKASAPYGQKISIDIPAQVQAPLTGVFSYITSVDVSISGKTTTGKGKKKKNRYFAAVTGCPSDKSHDVGVNLIYVQNDKGGAGESGIVNDEVDCRK